MTRGDAGATEGEYAAAVSWAHRVRIEATLVEMVLAGRLVIRLEGGELTFGIADARATRDKDAASRGAA